MLRCSSFVVAGGFFIFVLFAVVPLAAAAQMTQSTTSDGSPIQIKVHTPAVTQTLPATLFGSFLEPIGHSTYGGLWANVVDNPSFENGLWSIENSQKLVADEPALREASQLGLPLPWRPLFPLQGNRYAPVRGDAANSDQSLLIMGLPDQETGIVQTVYLPVKRELSYHGSLWIKHVLGDNTVSITLRRHAHPEQILASAQVIAASAKWTKYSVSLVLQRDQVAPLEPVDFVIGLHKDAHATQM